MAKNLMPNICKMLGIELGEEFKIKGDKDFEDKTFYLTIRGLKAKLDQYPNKEFLAMAALDSLLFGDTEIVKLPWRPDYRQKYWTFGLKDGIWVVVPREWEDYPAEILLADKGWTYRTREEAEDALPAVATEMGVEYEI